MNKGKSIKIKPLESIKKSSYSMDDIADKFVGITQEESIPKETTVIPKNYTKKNITESRFTIVIPSYLHTRIKKDCAINSISIKEALTEILLKEFPEK